MPKKIPFEEKQKWFEQSEQGVTVARLASNHKRDPRVISRGVEEVRRKRLSREARTDLLREAIKRHQEDLLQFVAQTADSIQPLPVHIESLLDSAGPPVSLPINGIRVSASELTYDEVELTVEEDIRWGLLKSHLGNDHAYALINRWKRAVIREVNSRLEIRSAILRRLVDEAGLVIDPNLGKRGTINHILVNGLIKSACSLALVETPAYRPQFFVSNSGEIFDRDRDICGRLSNEQIGLVEQFQRIPDELSAGDSGRELSRNHREAAEVGENAKRVLLTVGASFYFAGICDACARHGL